MPITDRIRQLGFRRWYERLLFEAHVWLTSCILGLVALFAGVELMFEATTFMRGLLGLATIIIGGLVAMTGLQRYAGLMLLGNRLSNAASCPQCDSNAHFDVLQTSAEARAKDQDAQDTAAIWLRVKCRKCGREWTIG